ncbi:MAG: sigma-70 family RNA polymerase sigma factor [Clostridia bacterium]|nr:sigma-70 family RNA polymerase sigma factor [Clostridia bacterium]
MEQNERFEQIYHETRDGLLRYLLIRTGADPETEDLFQEVYRKLYIRLTNSPLPILDPKRYVFTIAKKELSRFYQRTAKRKLKEQPIESCAETESDDEPIDERLLREERMDEVWRLLRDEPELNRRAFILFYGCNRSQKEIAAALGIREEAVRQRLYRTRERIRAMLERDERERRQL